MQEPTGRGITGGIHFAIDEINAAGGVLGREVEGIDIDEGLSTEEVISAFKKSISLHPNAIVGGCEKGTTTAAAPFIKESGIFYVNAVVGGLEKLITPYDESDYYGGFHIAGSAYQWLLPLKEHVKEQGYKTLAWVAFDVPFCRATETVLNSFWPNGEVHLVAEYYTQLDDPGPELTKVVASNPDAIMLGFYFEPTITAGLKKLEELNYRGTVIFDATSMNPEIAKKFASSLEGAYFLAPWLPDDSLKANMEFSEAFQKDQGYVPFELCVYGYTAIKAVCLAMEKAGTADDMGKIADAMYKSNFVSPWGKKALFLPGGQFMAPYAYFGQVKNGEQTVVFRTDLEPEDYNMPVEWNDAHQKGLAAYKKYMGR